MFLSINSFNRLTSPYFKIKYRYIKLYTDFFRMQSVDSVTTQHSEVQEISEGLARIRTGGKVFYNPVQEFNRDLSISVINVFAKQLEQENLKQKKNTNIKDDDIQITINKDKPSKEPGIKYDDGITILEALSATGLRSIRYAKEISGVKEVIANDISLAAVDDIKNNVTYNNIEHLVTPSHNNATLLMYQHSKERTFDVIDLDPYGCPSIFLDSTVQAIKEGGLLLITATDLAVLAGNSPETCYSKYGAVSLRMKCCHEMALRILLQCVESHANRYGRYIEPLLSVSADFYIRVFVRVYSGAYKCKFTTSKLSHVYHCTGCDSFALHPLGILKKNEKNEKLVKFGLATGPPVSHNCEHCLQPYHIGGPIWSAPIHSPNFVQEVLNSYPSHLKTSKRIEGVLNVILEELVDVPLYYTLERLCGTLHVETPPMLTIRSALLNEGFRVSYTHMNKTSIKTNAPSAVIWDIMRWWEKLHPISKKRIKEGTPSFNILKTPPTKEYSFKLHPEANPNSRKSGYVRFQENPSPYWGPGCRAMAKIGDQKMDKSRRNQGKRKRDSSEENVKKE